MVAGPNENPACRPGFRFGRVVRQLSSVVDSLFVRVLHAAESVFSFSGGLLRLPLGFKLGITRYFSGNFLGFALGLLNAPFDALFIHAVPRLLLRSPSQRLRSGDVPGGKVLVIGVAKSCRFAGHKLA
jgi:hypothetical protein